MNNAGRGAGYRQRKEARAQTTGKLIDLELPSGEIFTVREPNLEVFAVSGALPQSVGSKMQSAQKEGVTEEEAFGQLSEQEKEASFKFAKKLLQHISVNPRIVDDPQSDDELAIEDLEPDDMNFLLSWAGGGETLDSFRAKRQQSAPAKSDSAKLGAKGK